MGVGRNPGGSLGKWASRLQSSLSNPITADLTINDNILLAFGTNSAQTAVIVLNSAGLAADEELSNVIVGTSDHQGTAADSLIISNRTTDGDILMLVSDNGDSKEFLLANGDTADLQLGHGMSTATLKTASGDITIDPGASLNVTLTVDDADAFDISNDNSTYYLVDTRNTASGTIAHLIDTEDATIASATGAVYTLWAVPAATYTFTGSTQMTSLQEMMRLVGPTLATDAVALTIDKATTLSLIAPIEGTAGGGTVLTDTSALRILNTSGTPVNQHGILIETLTAGATADYMLTLGSTDADHNLIHVGVGGDPIFGWDESTDHFNFDKGIEITAGVLILGASEQAVGSHTGLTLRAPDHPGGTDTNSAGADLTISPGLGTGTGDVGTIIFSLPETVGSGTTVQTRAAAITFDMVASTTVTTITLNNNCIVSGTWDDLGSATTIDINGGTIDGTSIGASATSTIIGTTIDATTDFTIGATIITDGVLTDASGFAFTANVTINGSLLMGNDDLIHRDVNATITASTTQTQGNGALTAEVNEVSAVGSANDTVTLPTAVAGLKIHILNNGANTLQIFPASGDDLGQGADNATTMVAGNNVTFLAFDDTTWESV